MPAIFNPWFWLGILLSLAGAGFTGYRQGGKSARAECQASQIVTMQALIERHNELAKADTAAAMKAEKDKQSRITKSMEAQHAMELEAARNSKPECAWDDNERILLDGSINLQNGDSANPAGLLPDLVPKTGAPRLEDRPSSKGLVYPIKRKLWNM